MSRKEKLKNRLFTRPTDFTWDELKTVLEGNGFELKKNNGSRRKFLNLKKQVVINLHEPHPSKIIKLYIIDQVIGKLREIESEQN